MAQASMKDIKQRIRSVENTKQITKAMQLVASSKLRGARQRMEASRPFLERAGEAVSMLAAGQRDSKSAFLRVDPEAGKALVVVIAGDRGLAGSYNANVFKLVEEYRAERDIIVLPIGKKAREYYGHRGVELRACDIEKVDGVEASQCDALARSIVEGYLAGEYTQVRIACTRFKSVLTQRPRWIDALPITAGEGADTKRQMLFETGADGMLKVFVPHYLSGVLYAAICDSVVSEQAARRVAMDAATNNASEMIENLTLKYNRARQSSITQEITEIVAGADR
ncbi:MAG: ATP synthase F1 subunit gamma [Clostridiales bacterium]|nr:ATP synthase F1 subunit gamma [Clostridiales bacterium]